MLEAVKLGPLVHGREFHSKLSPVQMEGMSTAEVAVVTEDEEAAEMTTRS